MVVERVDEGGRQCIRQRHPARISLFVALPLRHLHRLQLLCGPCLVGAEVLQDADFRWLSWLVDGLDLGHPVFADSIAPLAGQPARGRAALNLSTVPIKREPRQARSIRFTMFRTTRGWCNRVSGNEHVCAILLEDTTNPIPALSYELSPTPELPNPSQCLPFKAYCTETVLGYAAPGPFSAWPILTVSLP